MFPPLGTISLHGFRSAASTILSERGFSPDVIEATLAHQDENPPCVQSGDLPAGASEAHAGVG
jgi:hypothetical protein